MINIILHNSAVNIDDFNMNSGTSSSDKCLYDIY